MAPFKTGDIVFSKSKPRKKGKIVSATNDNGKKHEWWVQFDNEEGTPRRMKSQQLLRKNPDLHEIAPTNNDHYLPTDGDRLPPPAAGAAGAAPPPPLLEETDASSSHGNDEDDDLLADLERRLNLDVDTTDEEEESEEESSTIYPFELPAANTDADEEEAEDEAEAEDVMPHGEIPVEPEDVHVAKWQQYQLDRAQLIVDGWIVTKTAGNDGINIGSVVRNRSQGVQRRQGEVVAQVEFDGRKMWMVDFNGDSPEPMRPQQLVLVNSNHEQYVWKLVADSEPEAGIANPEEYKDGIGLAGFNFLESFAAPAGNQSYGYPYLCLLQKMWPGNWKQQLRQLNTKIQADNDASVGRTTHKKVNLVSEQELWVFIGILVSAGPHGKGGNKLWEKHRDGRGVTQSIDYGPSGINVMAEYRFKQIKAAFPWSFQDTNKADTNDEQSYDPWNMALLLVDGYNANRHSWIAASYQKTLDETMSAWRPQTSKTGGLPHLSFILRKPEPLGTEFKTIACSVTGKRVAIFAVQKGHGRFVLIASVLIA
jgi:hypothetical protein